MRITIDEFGIIFITIAMDSPVCGWTRSSRSRKVSGRTLRTCAAGRPKDDPARIRRPVRTRGGRSRPAPVIPNGISGPCAHRGHPANRRGVDVDVDVDVDTVLHEIADAARSPTGTRYAAVTTIDGAG